MMINNFRRKNQLNHTEKYKRNFPIKNKLSQRNIVYELHETLNSQSKSSISKKKKTEIPSTHTSFSLTVIFITFNIFACDNFFNFHHPRQKKTEYFFVSRIFIFKLQVNKF